MLLGCVQRAFFGDVNAATARVLAAYGCEVLAPRDQGCCGALELHTGRAPAERRRTALLDRLDALGVDRIVVNSAGCGSSLKEADHPAAAQVRDVHEVLAELGPPPGLKRLDLRVAYHDACHLAHAQGVRAEPRSVLAADPRRAAARDCRTPRSAAARRASTTCCRATPRPSWGAARPRTSTRSAPT